MINIRIITKDDILPTLEFEKNRQQLRAEIVALKKKRRVSVGPDVTFYFENRQTLLWQIQEMLFIEKGGEEQLNDELAAYNPLVPRGDELVATMMIEIADEQRRRHTLAELGHIENYIRLIFDEHSIPALASEDNVDRTNEDGKTSAVHFLHFRFTQEQQDHFKKCDNATIDISHPRYSFSGVLDKDILTQLILDF